VCRPVAAGAAGAGPPRAGVDGLVLAACAGSGRPLGVEHVRTRLGL
jgi:hypothetical protein